MKDRPDIQAVKTFLLKLQEQICTALAEIDEGKPFVEDRQKRPGGGGGRPRMLEKGRVD